MNIKILGSGCANCTKVETIVKEVVVELGANAIIEKVTDPAQFMSYGVMRTPAIVIDEEVQVVGKVPSKEQVKKMVQQFLGN